VKSYFRRISNVQVNDEIVSASRGRTRSVKGTSARFSNRTANPAASCERDRAQNAFRFYGI
jgi:hypothetical protein